MNTLKTTAARLSRLAPQGPLRWLKLSVYVFIFLLPFGMAILALLIYLERRNRAGDAAPSRAALPAPSPAHASAPAATSVSTVDATPTSKRAASARKIQRNPLPNYCSQRP
jgi:hypothetical protein